MVAARKGAMAMFYPGAFNLTTGGMHWELLQRARYSVLFSANGGIVSYTCMYVELWTTKSM